MKNIIMTKIKARNNKTSFLFIVKLVIIIVAMNLSLWNIYVIGAC